jgi:hypothetical protein
VPTRSETAKHRKVRHRSPDHGLIFFISAIAISDAKSRSGNMRSIVIGSTTERTEMFVLPKAGRLRQSNGFGRRTGVGGFVSRNLTNASSGAGPGGVTGPS